MINTEKPSDVSEYLSRHSNPGHSEIEQETQAQICETGTPTWVKHNIFTLYDHLQPPYRFSLEATRL